MLASSWIDPATVPRPNGAPTESRRYAQELADTMAPKEVKRFDRGLQNIELEAERFVRSRFNGIHSRSTAGLSVMGSIAPGEVLITFADARKNGSAGSINPPLTALEFYAARAATLSELERRRSLVDTVISLRPRNRPAAVGDNPEELAIVSDALLRIAGLVVTRRDIAFLHSVRGAIPALAIIARTEKQIRPTVETRHIATRFPGQWFGTSTPAGRA